MPAYLVFFLCLVSITVIDADRQIIPNWIIYPTIFTSIPLLALAALAGDDWDRFGHALIGAAAAWTTLFLIHMISPGGMGFGDVRLSFVLGLFLGWISLLHVFTGMFLGVLIICAFGIVLAVLRLRSLKKHMAFGPFLALGSDPGRLRRRGHQPLVAGIAFRPREQVPDGVAPAVRPQEAAAAAADTAARPQDGSWRPAPRGRRGAQLPRRASSACDADYSSKRPAKRANAAPWGSRATAMRPAGGMSIGGTTTRPPSSVIRAAVASVSAVPKYGTQWERVSGIMPPLRLSPLKMPQYGVSSGPTDSNRQPKTPV